MRYTISFDFDHNYTTAIDTFLYNMGVRYDMDDTLQTGNVTVYQITIDQIQAIDKFCTNV